MKQQTYNRTKGEILHSRYSRPRTDKRNKGVRWVEVVSTGRVVPRVMVEQLIYFLLLDDTRTTK